MLYPNRIIFRDLKRLFFNNTCQFCSSHWSSLHMLMLIRSVEPDSCDPIDCSLPGSSAHGILQERIPEWVAISFSRWSPKPRDRTQVSCIAVSLFTDWDTREAQFYELGFIELLIMERCLTIDFYILILYLSSLPNSLVSSKDFYSFGDFYVDSYDIYKQEIFYLFFSKLCAFYFLLLPYCSS